MKAKNTKIQTEIKKISTIVANSLPTDRVFDIPQDYFVDLEETLMSQARISMETREDFNDIPKGYFVSNEERFLKNSAQPIFQRRSWMYAAASLAIVVMAVIFLNHKPLLPELETELAWVYIEENLNSLDLEDFIENQFLEEIDIETYDYIEEEMSDIFSEEIFLE